MNRDLPAPRGGLAWGLGIPAHAALAPILAWVPLRSSYDQGWHLKSGQYIAGNGIPKNEVLTYTAETSRGTSTNG